MKKIIRFFLNRIDLFIVLCDKLEKDMESILPKEKIIVIQNGRDVDISLMSENIKTNFNVLFLSNLIRSKGVFEVLKSIPNVLSKHPKVIFIFAGGWRNESDRIEASHFIQKHSLESNVKFLGSIDESEKGLLLAQADLFVLPSYYQYEGLPWAIIEAMAAGLPIISTNYACIPTCVLNEQNGYLIPIKNSQILSERITQLINDSEKRKSMGQLSFQLHQDNFTEAAFIHSLSSAFDKILFRSVKK